MGSRSQATMVGFFSVAPGKYGMEEPETHIFLRAGVWRGGDGWKIQRELHFWTGWNLVFPDIWEIQQRQKYCPKFNGSCFSMKWYIIRGKEVMDLIWMGETVLFSRPVNDKGEKIAKFASSFPPKKRRNTQKNICWKVHWIPARKRTLLTTPIKFSLRQRVGGVERIRVSFFHGNSSLLFCTSFHPWPLMCCTKCLRFPLKIIPFVR